MNDLTIRKIKKAEAGWGFSAHENTRLAGTYGVFRSETLVGCITGDVAYMATTEWTVEDYELTHPNGCPRTLAHYNTLAAAKAKALAVFGSR